MNKELLRAMLQALPDVKVDGASFTLEAGWDVTAYAGRAGAPLSVQQVVLVKLEEGFVSIETKKGQRHVLLLDELRGFSADPASSERRGGGAGFRPGA